MPSIVRLAALTFAAITFSIPVAFPVTADEGLQSGTYLAGRTAGRLRDIDAANTYVADALKYDPDNIVLIERLFLLELSAGDMSASEELAARVIKFNSQHRMARIALGLKDMREGHFVSARQHLAESAYTPVGELAAILLTAWTYAGEKNMGGAMAELGKLAGNDSFSSFKSFHEALIADYLNSPLRAQAAYKLAFEQAGTSLRVTQAYGRFLQRIGKTAEAIAVYNQMLATGDGNVLVEKELADLKTGKTPVALVSSILDGAGEALFALAAAMNDGDSVEVALVYAQFATALSKDKAVMLTMLGDIQADMSRFATSVDTYEQVPEASPLHSNAETEIALNLQRQDKSKEAQERLKALLAKDDKNYSAWVTLGNIYRSNDAFVDAEAAYGKAIAMFGGQQKENWQIYYYRGIALERLKKWDAAEADFRKALALSPEESSVLNYLGYSLIDRNIKLDEAIKMVQQAVDLRPNDGYIIDSLGWAYYQLGKYEDAVANLERAVEIKAGDPIIAEHLGDAYWKVGRKLEAQFQWQHAKDNEPEPEDLKRIEEKLRNGYTAKAEPPKN